MVRSPRVSGDAPGLLHTASDGPPRLRPRGPAANGSIDTASPDYAPSLVDPSQGPDGLVLDGTPLQSLALPVEAEDGDPLSDDISVARDDEPVLGGVPLGSVGSDGSGRPAGNVSGGCLRASADAGDTGRDGQAMRR